MRRALGLTFAVLTALVLAGACDDDTPTSPDPTDPPQTFTTTFTGGINPNGAQTHSFNTEAAGTITATLVSVAPDSSIRIGLSIGTWNGVSCNIIIANDQAQQGVSVTGNASALGSFCARIYDIGQLTENISYEVRVTHP